MSEDDDDNNYRNLTVEPIFHTVIYIKEFTYNSESLLLVLGCRRGEVTPLVTTRTSI